MIIDMHVHPFCKEATWDDLNKIADAMWGLDPQKRKYMHKMLKNTTESVSIKDYIGLMDKMGIDKAIIVSLNAKTSYDIILVTNEDVANFMEKYPDRLIGFAGIDMPSNDAVDQLEYSITSLGLKGLKLVPPVQKIDISDRKYDLIWRKMIDLNIPLWTHGGHQVSTGGSIAKYGHPLLIDEIAMRYEDLKIVIGHMGAPWFWDAYSVVLRHPNVYIDISAHPELYSYFPWDAFISYNLSHKIFFASDHPLVHWNKMIPAVYDLPLSDGLKKDIMGKNAQKFLRL
jgi:predicted TIM-barrel fold metal-dependent hydrolase